jgi:drug/metabolite transporter (DMT)-like permease
MFIHSGTLYAAAVLIWGSTWYAIKFQLGVVAPEVSVVYRFALASLLLLAYCRFSNRDLRFSARDHAFMALQGLLLFGINYVVFYWATGLMTSGLIAVVFSTIVLMNIFLAALFFGQRVEPLVVAGASLGLAGIALVFWPEFAISRSASNWHGIALSLLGTLLASLGNMSSVRNQRQGLPVIQSNAFGMGYGAGLMALWALAQGTQFTYDPAPAYTVSLLYLAVFGSIVAFGSYLTLLGRLGAGRAAYATVLFPIVALAISTAFEDYVWSVVSLSGVTLVLVGNLLVVSNRQALYRLSPFRSRA